MLESPPQLVFGKITSVLSRHRQTQYEEENDKFQSNLLRATDGSASNLKKDGVEEEKRLRHFPDRLIFCTNRPKMWGVYRKISLPRFFRPFASSHTRQS